MLLTRHVGSVVCGDFAWNQLSTLVAHVGMTLPALDVVVELCPQISLFASKAHDDIGSRVLLQGLLHRQSTLDVTGQTVLFSLLPTLTPR